ncbi:hypothetical protein MRX96_059473 [Rhipicephalus microplus]
MDVAWSPIARTYDPLKAGSIDGTDVKPHDHGIVRAMQATYKTSKYVKTEPRLTIFVARLSPTTTEDTIKEFFGQYGNVKSCHLIRDVVTGFSKRYAFVEFYDARDASAASNANQMLIDDCKVFVDFEEERLLPGWIPRRLGGGLGGKKESGQLSPLTTEGTSSLIAAKTATQGSDYKSRDYDRRDDSSREKRSSYERSRHHRYEGDYRSDRAERSHGRPYESGSDRRRKHDDHSSRESRDEFESRERRSRRSPV